MISSFSSFKTACFHLPGVPILLMLDGTYLSRNIATLGPYLSPPPVRLGERGGRLLGSNS